MSIAVVGAGKWGQNHIRVLREMGVLSLVCDADIKAIETVKSIYPDIRTTTKLDETLDATINGVVVATPPATHFELAQCLLASGKHLLVEKPLAMNSRDSEILIELANTHDRILMTGHLLEYHPAFQALKNKVQEGQIGALSYIYSTRLNFGRIRSIENVFLSFAPHDLGLILSLSGRLPTAIDYFEKAHFANRPADIALTHLQFGDSLQAHVHVSWLNPFKEHRFVAVGQSGFLVFDGVANSLAHYEATYDLSARNISTNLTPVKDEIFKDANPLKSQLEDFLHCIRTGVQPLASAETAHQVLKIIDFCRDRAETNRQALET